MLNEKLLFKKRVNNKRNKNKKNEPDIDIEIVIVLEKGVYFIRMYYKTNQP